MNRRSPLHRRIARHRGAIALAGALAAASVAAQAQSVAFSGMLGDKALLVIDGQARGVAVGATVQGVRLVRVDGAQAQVEVGGRVQSLRLGGTAVVAGDPGAGASGKRIVLPSGSGGHYTGLGAINGHPIRFMVDTGATSVAFGADVAAQLGIDPGAGTALTASTANGPVTVHLVKLARVSVGDVTVYDVDGMVVPQAMPVVLLGNSFLSHFQMQSNAGSLVLDKKN